MAVGDARQPESEFAYFPIMQLHCHRLSRVKIAVTND